VISNKEKKKEKRMASLVLTFLSFFWRHEVLSDRDSNWGKGKGRHIFFSLDVITH